MTPSARPEPIPVPLVLLGPGRVGRQLLSRLLSRGPALAQRDGIALQVAAIGDGSGLVQAAGRGLSDSAIRDVLDRKSAGGALADWPSGLHGASATATLSGAGIERLGATPLLVDTSAADTTATLLDARTRGWRLVLANKTPLVGSMQAFDQITQGGRGARWETTVASSLPVVQTLLTLLDAGDDVHRISGTLSGSLGFVVDALERGETLSAAVRRAIELGLAEPDPRSDLSGRDVARKALILARMLGHDLDLADVQVEGLIPAAFDDLDAEEALHRLPELDDTVSARVAAVPGTALRYLATIDGGKVRARLVDLDRLSPLAGAPSNSVVMFETEAYRQHPLLLAGRAGGPVGAALGVMADIVSLARQGRNAAGR